ncbi:polysaccharide deacetylase [Modestobacter italicus]|uniref:Polysaccharide deacetylase n=1 Tax=Modestobacter italicus (strain DSM 44449 / CECT 9708 / BC 501) TaxID=2732864 RepID=I4ESQ0_MODI5|nr:polysaccharide deacetylase family protein [Modestobacter marinus]CCH86413.1 polysaccharide deacetylase [Modestobacter marinus]
MSTPTTAARTPLRVRPVLMYHSISASTAPDPHRLRVHPDRLDRHLRRLRRLGLRGVGLTELLRAQERGEAGRLVALTFDDGYTDFLEHAAPLLQRHGMTATLYVVAGRMDGANDWDSGPRLPIMGADQVRAVAAAGHEVGSHTMTHARLAGADPATLTAEVTGSRRVLQDVLQAEVAGFCYPYGAYDTAAADAVAAAGYDNGCVIGDYSPGDRFTVPRCYVSPQDTAAHLVARMARHQLLQRGR